MYVCMYRYVCMYSTFYILFQIHKVSLTHCFVMAAVIIERPLSLSLVVAQSH